MINFRSFFRNWFDTKEISDDNLKKFTQDHLQRSTAKNGSGLFTTMIADTTTAYTSYFGKITDEDLAAAIQQSLTRSADNLIATFKQTSSQKEGLVRSLYGVDGPAYQEFFPHGLTEFSNATKANVETLMTRMVNSGTAHSADVGAGFVTLFTNIKSNYLTARTAQLLKIGEVTGDKTQTSQTRDVVEIQLCKNVHLVGFTFPGDINECIDFFDQNIIDRNIDHDHDGVGQAGGIIQKTGVPVSGALIEILNENYRNSHSKTAGNYRSVNLTAPKNYTFRVTLPTGEVMEKTVLVTDEGTTPLDFDF